MTGDCLQRQQGGRDRRLPTKAARVGDVTGDCLQRQEERSRNT